MEMTSNNIANAETPGYRAQYPLFKEYVSDPSGAKNPLSMVYDKSQYSTVTPGPATQTGATYDVALEGPGFFGVKTVTGGTQYTRAGNFTIDQTGTLVTANGLTVAGAGGTPILVPEGTEAVTITPQGDVIADGNTVGSLSITEFANVQDLQPEGNGLYSTTQTGTPATSTIVHQGMIEGSNVNTVSEMSRMIEISRQYEQTMNMLKNESDRQTNALQRLAKVNG
jgi:flagellar basal-body rod protein FlgF